MDNSNDNSDQPITTPVNDIPMSSSDTPSDTQSIPSEDIQSPTDLQTTTPNEPEETQEAVDTTPAESEPTTMAEVEEDQSTTNTPSPEPESVEQTPPTPVQPQEEPPLIDLPRPKPAIEAHETDGQTSSTSTAPTPQPATLPDKPIIGDYLQSRNKPAIIAITSVILLVITAGLAFLYVQNSRLKGQIRTIEDINSQRNLPPISPTASPSAMAQNKNTSVFADIDTVIAKAQSESATAQLLMVTVDGQTLKDSKGSTYNYWFRTGPDTGQYFQIAKPYAGEYQLIKPATVNPDNNIPDLLQSHKTNTLGIDDQQVIKLGWEKVASQFSQGNEPQTISLIYIVANPSNPAITTPINLWQVSYLFPQESGVEDVIIQVNANNQNIVFTNKNITVPTNEATVSATPTSSQNN